MKLNGRYIIEDPKNDVKWEISSYADLYNKLNLDIFSDLSQKGRDILLYELNDDNSKNYIEMYLRNKQVANYIDGTIDVEGISKMLNRGSRTDISEKTGISATSLSKIARGMKKMNPDKGKIQVTELRNVRFSTLLMLAYYYDEFYKLDKDGNNTKDSNVKKIVVGNIYHCQRCDFTVSGSRYCPNCGIEVEY